MYAALIVLTTVLDETPEAEDVVAGWTAFGLFGLGLVAVALLGVSLTRHLKRAAQAETEGRFDPTDRAPRHQPRVDSGESDRSAR